MQAYAGFAGWEILYKLLTRLNESGDAEGERLERLAARLGGCVGEAATWANEELKSKIEKSSLTLGGTDLLLVMSRGEGVRELLEVQMKSVFAEVLKEAKARAASELELAGSGSSVAGGDLLDRGQLSSGAGPAGTALL